MKNEESPAVWDFTDIHLQLLHRSRPRLWAGSSSRTYFWMSAAFTLKIPEKLWVSSACWAGSPESSEVCVCVWASSIHPGVDKVRSLFLVRRFSALHHHIALCQNSGRQSETHWNFLGSLISSNFYSRELGERQSRHHRLSWGNRIEPQVFMYTQ